MPIINNQGNNSDMSRGQTVFSMSPTQDPPPLAARTEARRELLRDRVAEDRGSEPPPPTAAGDDNNKGKTGAEVNESKVAVAQDANNTNHKTPLNEFIEGISKIHKMARLLLFMFLFIGKTINYIFDFFDINLEMGYTYFALYTILFLLFVILPLRKSVFD